MRKRKQTRTGWFANDSNKSNRTRYTIYRIINQFIMEGKVFGMLTVVRYAYSKDKNRYWECICECGKTTFVSTNSLNMGNTKSCGCYQRQKAHETGLSNATHNLSKENGKKTRLFRIWTGIKTRCYNTNDKAYRHYGLRGIKVCAEWLSFENFHNWSIKNGYSESLSIDRIDNDKSYYPENCRWATTKEQSCNKRTSRVFNINGVQKTLKQLADENSLSINCVFERLKRGKSIEEAILPINKKVKRY